MGARRQSIREISMNRLLSVSLKHRLLMKSDDMQNNRLLRQVGKEVAAHFRISPVQTGGLDPRPVIFFRASTGLLRLSQNTAFGLLASWGLQLGGVPVIHFVCQTGMSRCVQGTNKFDH